MPYLVDTNALLRWAQPADIHYAVVVAAIEALVASGDTVHVCPQNLVELWSVLTRPVKNNGYGLSPSVADGLIAQIERRFPLLEDTPDIHMHWRRLVVEASVSGRQVHDARIAAVMLAHGVTHLLTFNTTDFARYAGITAVDPGEV